MEARVKDVGGLVEQSRTRKGLPVMQRETVMQISGEEHSTKLLKNFSPGAKQEMTAALEPAAEEEANNIDFDELYEELEALERRVDMQSRHIQ
jgi:hypothetical protein